MNFIADSDAAGKRLDVWLAGKISDGSRSHVQKLIADGLVTVDGANVKSSHKLAGGEAVDVAEVVAATIKFNEAKR